MARINKKKNDVGDDGNRPDNKKTKTVVQPAVNPIYPTKPNLGLVDFARDPEGSRAKMERYEEELKAWSDARKIPVEEVIRDLPEIRLDSLKEWSVDLRIYERLFMSEIPYAFPAMWFKDEDVGSYKRISQTHQTINDGLPLLDTGYKNLMVMTTDKGFEEFTEWCRGHSGIKIIGITQVTF